jgi:GT2 family glycosyltransferase
MVLISVIIPTCSAPAVLQETIRSLFGVAVPADWTVEILATENGGPRGVEAMLSALSPPKGFRLRYLFDPRQGKSRALNTAVRSAEGEVLLFTDDDIRFPSDWITSMCQPIVDGTADVAFGGCRLAPHLLRDWMTKYHRGFLGSTEYLSDTNPSEMAGANMGCARAVFSKVPQFDCELGGGGLGNCEDSLLGRQLREAGFRVVPRTKLVVEHHPSHARLTYQGWLTVARNGGRSKGYLSYHWSHETIPFLRFRLGLLRLKLAIRMLFASKRAPDHEGIPAWELSYRFDIALYEKVLAEEGQPRKYARHGLTKLSAEPARNDQDISAVGSNGAT